MDDVEVVDRGSREIVVFLRGMIGPATESKLAAALQEVSLLEDLGNLDRVVVDTREVTAFDECGLRFLLEMERRGQAEGYEVAFSMISQPVLRALDRAHWHHLPLYS
ncbi:STAS domain-containing protein [Actinopolymorpha alba]|uniref:STAS domain-containing protein n=1 Tax=Actinopolymorpha alba TaxID=533267 RepID=UPI00036692A0|nr:STAS domain-containing protein [Actinopolymorpha alba]